jgi:alpha-D-ribose 1-methylphosphonate 5-triphosphate synthase subunit PhnH
VLPDCQVAVVKVTEWFAVSAADQTANETKALRSGNAFGREAGETNIAQPAYRKLHGAQVLCSAGNGIRETLVTALSEKS